MGLSVRIDGRRVYPVLVCDAPGCGGEIDYDEATHASVVAVPGADPVSVQLACGDACKRALLALTPGLVGVDLEDYWESMAIRLGFDDDDDAALGADDFLEALDALEVLVQRPGIPAGLTVRNAVGLGYIGRAHVATALPGSP